MRLRCSRTRRSEVSHVPNRRVRFGTLSGRDTPSNPINSALVAVVRCRAKYAKTARGIWSSNAAISQAERQLAKQAEASYERLVKDRQAAAPARKVGASVTAERA